MIFENPIREMNHHGYFEKARPLYPQWILYLESRGIKVADNVKTLWLKK